MILTINTSTGKKRTTEPVEREHLWFDYETGKMQKIRGGTLEFRYDNGKMRVSPKPLNVVVYKQQDNMDSIKSWFAKHKSDLSLELMDCGKHSCTFSFPDEMEKEVEDAVYDERFDYEIK